MNNMNLLNTTEFNYQILHNKNFWVSLSRKEKVLYAFKFYYEKEINENLIDIYNLINRTKLKVYLCEKTYTAESALREILISINSNQDQYLLVVCTILEFEITNYNFTEYSTLQSWQYHKYLVPSNDFLYDLTSLRKLRPNYFKKNELIQKAFMESSIVLSYSKFQFNEAQIVEIYNSLSYKKISLSTPILAKLRHYTPDDRINLASCFIMDAADNFYSIVETIKASCYISSNLGGVGLNMGRLRSQQMKTKNGNLAAGVSNTAQIYDVLSSIFSNTKPRKSAYTLSIPDFHLDLLYFLDSKRETGGSLHTKNFNIFHQVSIHDEFMKRVINKDDWYLLDPKNIKMKFGIDLNNIFGDEFSKAYNHIIEYIENHLNDNDILYQKIPARKVFIEIQHTMIETGVPFLAFICTINRLNPNPHVGHINSVNLCVESFSAMQTINPKINQIGKSHVCNLLSLNLSNLEFSEIAYYSKLGVHILNAIVDISRHDIESIQAHNKSMRVLGVGVLGYADYLAWNNIKYVDSAQIAENITEEMALSCLEASCDDVDIIGKYEYFANSQYEKGIFYGQDVNQMSDRWKTLHDKILQKGLSNAQVMAFAPTAATSLIMNAQPTILPAYAKIVLDNNLSSSRQVNIPKFSMTKSYCIIQNIKMTDMFNIIQSFQKYIDSGISAELFYFFQEKITEFDPKQVFEDLIRIWQKNIKTTYYVRINKSDFMNHKDSPCESCSS